jgi:hypothetical protein
MSRACETNSVDVMPQFTGVMRVFPQNAAAPTSDGTNLA